MNPILKLIFLFASFSVSAQLTISSTKNTHEVIWNKKQDAIAIKVNFFQSDSSLHNKIIFYNETQLIRANLIFDTVFIKNWRENINSFLMILIDKNDSIAISDMSTGRTLSPYFDINKCKFEKLPPAGYSDVSSWNYKYKRLTIEDSCLNLYIDMRRYNLIKKGTYRLIIMYRYYSNKMADDFTYATEKLIKENNLNKNEIFNGILKSNSLTIKVN